MTPEQWRRAYRRDLRVPYTGAMTDEERIRQIDLHNLLTVIGALMIGAGLALFVLVFL